jgi:hypothetical protein
MAKVSFLDKIKAKKITNFTFVDYKKMFITPTEGEERKVYLMLELETPIEKVVGFQYEYDPNTNGRLALAQTDVDCIKISWDLLEKYEEEFEFEADDKGELTGSGSYNGDMFLDVARSGDVWLTDTKLSKFGQDKKNAERSERYSKLLKIHGKSE